MVQFRFKLVAVLLLWKNNIADFTVNVQENSDSRHLDDCMLVNVYIVNRCRSNNDSNESLKQNYTTLIGVISLTCPDALFEGIYNYLQMIKDDELLK
jgi:hypothetical protein